MADSPTFSLPEIYDAMAYAQKRVAQSSDASLIGAFYGALLEIERIRDKLPGPSRVTGELKTPHSQVIEKAHADGQAAS